MSTCRIHVFCGIATSVMLYYTFSRWCTNRSSYNNRLRFSFFIYVFQVFFAVSAACFVTFVKSNAKALSTGKPIKNATCKQVLRSPRGKGSPLKRVPCTQRKLLYCHFPKRNIARLQVSILLQCCNLDYAASCQYHFEPILIDWTSKLFFTVSSIRLEIPILSAFCWMTCCGHFPSARQSVIRLSAISDFFCRLKPLSKSSIEMS